MWTPSSGDALVAELRTYAKDFRNWIDSIEGVIGTFEHAVDTIEARLPEVELHELQQLVTIWLEYEAHSSTGLADAHRHIDTWGRALLHTAKTVGR